MTSLVPSFERAFMAVERVERLMRRVTVALDDAGVRYAIVGGNAVAAWVGSVDEGAVRHTKGVDILLERSDLNVATAALEHVGLGRQEVLGVTMFVGADDPRPSQGVHVIFAHERVRPTDRDVTPGLEGAVLSDLGFWVIDLYSLVVMKLSAYRRADQVHLEDLLRLGLVTAELAARLPVELLARLRHVRDTMEWQTTPPVF